MSQVLGAWWTYVLVYVSLMLTFYLIGKVRLSLAIRKLLASNDDEDCEYCNENDKNCTLQLSMILPRLDSAIFDRVQSLLQSNLDSNFLQMVGEQRHLDDDFRIITYSLKGEGPKDGLRIFGEFDKIVAQEKVPYHLIAVKRLGLMDDPWGYTTLNEVNKLGIFE